MGFFGYAAKILGISALIGYLSGGCASESIPAPVQPSHGFIFYSSAPQTTQRPQPRQRRQRRPAATSAQSPAQNPASGNVPGDSDPSSDGHEFEGIVGVYIQGMANSEGDSGVGGGVRYRAKQSKPGEKVEWEADLRARTILGKVAGEDGNPDEEFNSSKARAAVSAKWKSGNNVYKAFLGIDGYWRDSETGNGPDIGSSGVYAAFGWANREEMMKAFASFQALGGDWDYGGLNGEPFSKTRAAGFFHKGLGGRQYAGVEAKGSTTDYGDNGPKDTNLELVAVYGWNRLGEFKRLQLGVGYEEEGHRISEDEAGLELKLEGIIPLGEDSNSELRFQVKNGVDGVEADAAVFLNF